jgi:hypothetical protein
LGVGGEQRIRQSAELVDAESAGSEPPADEEARRRAYSRRRPALRDGVDVLEQDLAGEALLERVARRAVLMRNFKQPGERCRSWPASSTIAA